MDIPKTEGEKLTTEQIAERVIADQKQSAKLLIRRDLELSRANERLRELDRMKTDFVTIAAHQLRTPMSGIRWTVSMLLNGDLGPLTPDQKSFLEKAYQSTARMISLLNDLLLVDQIESGKMEYAPVPTSALIVCEEVVTELRSLAEMRALNFKCIHEKSEYPMMLVDPKQIHAVFQNLLENAIKYTKPGGTVSIEIREDEPNTLLFVISDTGIGIPKEGQQQLFTRFYRAENALREQTDGSGLGLFIAKSIVEKYKGKIWVESVEGKGSTFYVRLPTIPAKE